MPASGSQDFRHLKSLEDVTKFSASRRANQFSGSSPTNQLVGTRTALAALHRPAVMFLVRSFNRGGAERQLTTLVVGLKRLGWPVSVACFYAGGPFQREVEDAGVPVFELGKNGRWDVLGFLFRLYRLLRKERPEILHGYLPVPNLVALLARPCHTRTRVVWGIRASHLDLPRNDRIARVVSFLERRFARFADLIIVNSRAGFEYHAARGFPEQKMRIIHNGIDTTRFRFDAEARHRVRREWSVPETAPLVGLVGRLDPMKDHRTFLLAAKALAESDPCWRFVCVGDGPADYRAALMAQADALALSGRLIWTGARGDMPAVYSALDIAVSASYGEGFPNVIAEAMACGRPCVVTDVGDSAAIIGELGEVVPPRNPAALAMGIARVGTSLLRDGDTASAMARAAVVSSFSVDALLRATASALCVVRQRPDERY